MKVLVYIVHPAHYHLFKNVIQLLRRKKHNVQIVIRDKDILRELLEEAYLEVKQLKKNNNRFLKIADLAYRIITFFNIVRKNRPDIICSCASEAEYIGRLFNIPTLFFDEDDLDLDPVKHFANITFPFSKVIIMPKGCRAAKWENKVIYYSGYHELSYLHPSIFTPNISKVQKLIKNSSRYFIIRFSSFQAYHDKSAKGITDNLAIMVINILEQHGNVYITSEKKLMPFLEKYRITIPPKNMHDAMYYSDLIIGDSQTMAVEASVLGVPNIRFNSFACKTNVSVLEELEHKYNLTFGINNKNHSIFLAKIKELVTTENIREIWNIRRNKMLSEKINVSSFFVWFIEYYPGSIRILGKNPDFQESFK